MTPQEDVELRNERLDDLRRQACNQDCELYSMEVHRDKDTASLRDLAASGTIGKSLDAGLVTEEVPQLQGERPLPANEPDVEGVEAPSVGCTATDRELVRSYLRSFVRQCASKAMDRVAAEQTICCSLEEQAMATPVPSDGAAIDAGATPVEKPLDVSCDTVANSHSRHEKPEAFDSATACLDVHAEASAFERARRAAQEAAVAAERALAQAIQREKEAVTAMRSIVGPPVAEVLPCDAVLPETSAHGATRVPPSDACVAVVSCDDTQLLGVQPDSCARSGLESGIQKSLHEPASDTSCCFGNGAGIGERAKALTNAASDVAASLGFELDARCVMVRSMDATKAADCSNSLGLQLQRQAYENRADAAGACAVAGGFSPVDSPGVPFCLGADCGADHAASILGHRGCADVAAPLPMVDDLVAQVLQEVEGLRRDALRDAEARLAGKTVEAKFSWPSTVADAPALAVKRSYAASFLPAVPPAGLTSPRALAHPEHEGKTSRALLGTCTEIMSDHDLHPRVVASTTEGVATCVGAIGSQRRNVIASSSEASVACPSAMSALPSAKAPYYSAATSVGAMLEPEASAIALAQAVLDASTPEGRAAAVASFASAANSLARPLATASSAQDSRLEETLKVARMHGPNDGDSAVLASSSVREIDSMAQSYGGYCVSPSSRVIAGTLQEALAATKIDTSESLIRALTAAGAQVGDCPAAETLATIPAATASLSEPRALEGLSAANATAVLEACTAEARAAALAQAVLEATTSDGRAAAAALFAAATNSPKAYDARTQMVPASNSDARVLPAEVLTAGIGLNQFPVVPNPFRTPGIHPADAHSQLSAAPVVLPLCAQINDATQLCYASEHVRAVSALESFTAADAASDAQSLEQAMRLSTPELHRCEQHGKAVEDSGSCAGSVASLSQTGTQVNEHSMLAAEAIVATHATIGVAAQSDAQQQIQASGARATESSSLEPPSRLGHLPTPTLRQENGRLRAECEALREEIHRRQAARLSPVAEFSRSVALGVDVAFATLRRG